MNKKLEKSSHNKKLCGVCAGVAHYFDIDPTLVRIIWAIFAIMYGTGAVLYAVCAVIMPESLDF